MISYLNFMQVLEIHDEIIKNIGGVPGNTEQGAGQVKSVLEHIQNDDYYPSLYDKAAHLFFSIVKFHCFIDGNKRTAITSTLVFLDINNISVLGKDVTKLENTAVGVAEGKINKERVKQILQGIK